MTDLLAIDPGVHACGFAYFSDNQLWHAEYSPDVPFSAFGHTILEVPRAYPRSKVRPNDLIDLALAGGIAAARAGGLLVKVHPAEWKGTVPADIMLRRIENALTEAERECIKWAGAKSHNILDAIGIGLWYIGRLNRRKT